MARTKLSTLARRMPTIRIGRETGEPGRGYNMLRFIASNGRLLFTVSPDDLFDADGNRFEDDLP